MAKLTADTITDEQIRELRADARDCGDYSLEDLCTEALYRDSAGRDARARCAEVWNARAEGK